MKTMKIGIVGIGVISGIYLENIAHQFDNVEVCAVCDLIRKKAENAVEKYNIPKIYDTMEELFQDPEIDIVLNLTRPYEHFAVSFGALQAGKHVYTEKPLGATFEEGIQLVKLAEEKGLSIGGAPDTFMGAGITTCKKLIQDGYIGDIVGACANMTCRGHETWHEDPEFYYQFGGGPMLDMGPYYLTALVNLIGNVESVCAMTKVTFPVRTITSQPLCGKEIHVEVPTYINGLMHFENGAIGNILTTFDVYRAELPRIEIYGSKGTLSVPDPNTFGGPVRLYREGNQDFIEMPLLFPYHENSRALGLSDMAAAIYENRSPKADSRLIFHVLEIMQAFQKSSDENKHISIESRAL